MLTGVRLQQPLRIVVDPNSMSRRDPALSLVGFEDLESLPQPGELVYAVQPDEDGECLIGLARVVSVDYEAELIHLRVDWSSVRPEPSQADWLADELAHAGRLTIKTVWPAFGVERPLAEPFSRERDQTARRPLVTLG